MNEKYIFTIVLGDEYWDGHGKSQTYVISSNKNVSEVKAVDKGMPLQMDKICSNYEDASIDHDTVEEMKSMGIEFDKFEGYMDQDGYFYPTLETFVEIWLDLLMIQDPSLTLEIILLDSLHAGRSIGYGLFD